MADAVRAASAGAVTDSGASAVSCTPPTGIAKVVRALRSAWWYLRSVMGETAYENYVAHLRRHNPDADVPTEREFWREKFAEQAKNPNTRCC